MRDKFISGLYLRQTINTKKLEIQPKFINWFCWPQIFYPLFIPKQHVIKCYIFIGICCKNHIVMALQWAFDHSCILDGSILEISWKHICKQLKSLKCSWPTFSKTHPSFIYSYSVSIIVLPVNRYGGFIASVTSFFISLCTRYIVRSAAGFLNAVGA